MIELEKRALLDKTELRRLAKFFASDKSKSKQIRRFTMVYSERPDGIDTEGLADLRLRVTDGQAQLTLKYGSWHDSSGRQEYEINLDKGQLDEMINVMNLLGHKWGNVNFVNREKFRYMDFEIVIDSHLDYDRALIEIELAVESKDELPEAETKLATLLHELGLKAMKSEDMIEFVRELNSREHMRFNFTTEKVSDFVTKWQKYWD